MEYFLSMVTTKGLGVCSFDVYASRVCLCISGHGLIALPALGGGDTRDEPWHMMVCGASTEIPSLLSFLFSRYLRSLLVCKTLVVVEIGRLCE